MNDSGAHEPGITNLATFTSPAVLIQQVLSLYQNNSAPRETEGAVRLEGAMQRKQRLGSW